MDKGKKMAKENRLAGLDFFRIFLCMMVLFFHAVEHNAWKIGGVDSFWFREFKVGAIYMDAFFMVSGFILYYLYSNINLSTIKNIKNFYMKRVIRIYPIYIIHTGIWCIFYKKFEISVLPAILLGIQSFFPPLFNKMGVGGTWFISVILFCYLLFPILATIVNNNKKSIWKLIIPAYLLVVYANAIAAYWNVQKISLYINPVYRVLIFFVGMCVAYIFMNKKNDRSTPLWRSLIYFIVLFVTVPILYKNNFFNHKDFATNWTYYSCFTIPIFGLIIYSLANCKNVVFNKVCSSFLITHLANISLCFFFAQSYSINIFKTHFKKYSSNPSTSIFIVIGLTYLIAVALYYLAEKPVTIILSRYLKKKEIIR